MGIYRILCSRYRGKLTAYASGVLPSREAERIASHLDRCPACWEELTAVMAMTDLLADVSPALPEVSSDLWTRLEARIQTEAPRAPRRETPFALPAIGFATAAAAVIVGVAVKVTPMRPLPALADLVSVDFFTRTSSDAPRPRVQVAAGVSRNKRTSFHPLAGTSFDPAAPPAAAAPDPFRNRFHPPSALAMLDQAVRVPAASFSPEPSSAYVPQVQATPPPPAPVVSSPLRVADAEPSVRIGRRRNHQGSSDPDGGIRTVASAGASGSAAEPGEGPSPAPGEGPPDLDPVRNAATAIGPASENDEMTGRVMGALTSPTEAVNQARRARSLFR